MAQLFRTVFIVFLGMLLSAFTGACTGINAFPRELTNVADGMVQMVADQGVLDAFQSNLEGNIQDPGVESYVKVTFATGVNLTGLNGEMDLVTGGAGTQLPKGLRDSLIEQLNGPISDEQRTAILEILGWNRTAPNPDGG